MSNTKHTPAPWKVFYKHKYNEWHVALPTPGKAMMLGLFENGIQTENPEADARLIAAAPELLEVAEEVVTMLDYEVVCDCCNSNNRRYCVSHCPFYKLKAAVERAKGGGK